MPPKGRGRGSTRGRGRSRGGATAARSGAGSPEEAPPEAQAQKSASADSPIEQPEVPSATEPNASATIETPTANVATVVSTSSAASPQTTADSPARPLAQRLESLKSIEPTSRPSSPAARRTGAARGKKPAVIKPFSARRNKESKEALDKTINQWNKERRDEWLAEERQRQKDRAQQKKNDRGFNRGRGGYSGTTSGPFSLGNVGRERRTENRVPSSGSRATRVKREDHDDDDGEGRARRPRGTAIKREEGGTVPSDDDDDEIGYPRKDIDFIEISSDEEEEGSSERKERAQRSHTPSMLMPVRIGRREHTDRVVGINTEASSEAAAKILQQAEATGSEIKEEGLMTVPRKSKGKTKDVEITGVRKPFKGMWQDEDEPQVQVKLEPATDDDEEMPDVELVGLSGPSKRDTGKTPLRSPDAGRPVKLRTHKGRGPVFQTDDERAEYYRIRADQRAVRSELGPEPEVDANGDTDMKDSDDNFDTPKRSVRDNNCYLFHFPPKMPGPNPPGTKNQPPELTQNASGQLTNDTKKASKTDDGISKWMKKVKSFRVAPGHIGKLYVYQSGRTDLNYGGEKFELTAGIDTIFMQEIVDVINVPENMRVVPEDGGDSTSFSRVKGKFVVTPTLDAMLGKK